MTAAARLLLGVAAATLLFAAPSASAPSASASAAAAPSPGPLLQQSFIWTPPSQSVAGQQQYSAFRTTFSLGSGLPAVAALHLFADARYWLFINGQYVLSGPGRFNPARPEFDTVDVLPFLQQAGPNVIALLVHNYGSAAINGRIMFHSPGLTAALDTGGAFPIVTNSTWRCSNVTQYQPSPVAWSSIPDTIDLRVDVGAWTSPAFDDSAWALATAVDGSTWGALQPRMLPLPRETPLTALRLLYPSVGPLDGKLPITLSQGQSIQIDLGVMAMAYTTFLLESSVAGNLLQLEYYIGYVNGAPSENHGIGGSYTLRAGSQSVTGLDVWVAHYLVVGFAAGSGTIVLRNISTTNRAYPFERMGSFSSSEALLATLWTRAVNTIVAVTDDAYGSDARERNEWLQDPAQPNYITTSVALVGPAVVAGGPPAFADPRLLLQILRHAALTQQPDGKVLATFPTDRGPSDCHWFIEDYAMQWVEALRIYFDATGDADFVAEVWDVLARQLAYFSNITAAQPNGLLLAREYTSFDDALAYITVQGTALNAFYYHALRDAAYLGNALGNRSAAAAYAAAADALAAAINAHLWNTSVGSYSAGILPSGEVLEPSVHAALLALERGAATAPDRVAGARAFFLSNYKNPGSFHVCSNPDFRAMLAAKAGINEPVTYYWVFSMLYAIDSAAADLEALSEMRRRWAPMLARNDTGTLWESFDDSESCHNYGAVPAFFLSSRVLGVRRVPGPASQRRLLIEPRLADLASAGGAVPTELGIVTVQWTRGGDGLLSFAIELPPGAAAASMRFADADGATLNVNGQATPTTQEGRYAVAADVAGPGRFAGSIAAKRV